MNALDIILTIIVSAVIIRAAVKVYRQRKKGGCSCGCDSCPSKGQCGK